VKLPKLSKRIIVVLAIILVALLALLVWFFVLRDSKPVAQTKEAIAVRGDIDVYIEADGIVSAEKANLNFAQTGALKEINVKVGYVVKTGDALASIDAGKLQYQVDQALATYNTNVAKANRLKPGSGGEEIAIKEQLVQAASIALDAERNIYNDVVNKYGAGSTQEITEYSKLKKAESDLSSAQAQLALTAATYKDAQYAVSSSLANLQIARLALSEATLKSPIDGVVTTINGSVGQLVGGTQQSSTSFITVSQTDNIVLISNLDEEDISKIKVGQSIEAEFTSLSKTLQGTVTYVSPASKTDTSGSVTYEVRMQLISPTTGLMDGMTASIKFITKSVSDVTKIPNNAVKMINGKPYVYYYGEAKEVLNKEIVTGFTDGQNVQVVKGLSVGDKFIITSVK